MAQDTFFSSKKTLNIRGNAVSLNVPLVMGILNVTPDSFYEGSRVEQEKEIITRATKMVEDGAAIIDIGGYSTRPGAVDISVKEEIDRVIPAIKAIRKELTDSYISIDTFRSEVAKEALNAGADIINDVSGGELDDGMFDLIEQTNVPYILMHMRGTPQTMKEYTNYDHLILEIIDYFQKKVTDLRARGIHDIIIDPGFGFAKTVPQNFELLKKLKELKTLELPILVGISRKSMIYKSLDISAAEALNGTTALNMIALQNGASILRVHDVKEAAETVKLFNLTYIK
ncbi:dihydropteroate synthase [Fulvivirga lutea]|nr:dihydropteroate synthase [Fulvivirga lutea]